MKHPKPPLPEGWYYPTITEADALQQELQRELPQGHRLFGLAVETFAAREGTDDVLYRYLHETDRFVIVHLSWIGRIEIDTHHPSIVFEGTFAEFLTEEERLYGLKPPQ